VQGLGIVGALLTMQTIFWEYARMRPDYGFIVDPWSMRGFETVHGTIAVVIGAIALVAFLAVAWDGSERPRNGALIVLGVAVSGALMTAVLGGGDYTMTPGFPVIALLTLTLTMIAFGAVRSLTRDRAFMQNFWRRQAILWGMAVVIAVVIEQTIGGKELSTPQWVAVGVVMAIVAGLSLAPEPRQLAANRMLMFSSVIAAIALALSAGAVRSTLLRLQVEAGGVPALYKDTQVTSGHLMAVFGMVFVFFASVALWARRRDAIMTAQRAQRQRAAAEASAAEIQAALEHVGSE
jgi:uncharacterized membrane protein